MCESKYCFLVPDRARIISARQEPGRNYYSSSGGAADLIFGGSAEAGVDRIQLPIRKIAEAHAASLVVGLLRRLVCINFGFADAVVFFPGHHSATKYLHPDIAVSIEVDLNFGIRLKLHCAGL